MKHTPIICMILFLLAFFAENVIGAVIYVDKAAGGDNDGTSWSNAYTELQSALAEAQTGDEIWVAEGTYKPDQYAATPYGTGNRSDAFQLKNGVAVYGGFDPTNGDALMSDRNWKKNPTILSGDIGTPANITDNSYHVFHHPSGTNLDSSALLDGFIITNGNANGSVYPDHNGGGVFNRESSPRFENCAFTGNSASVGAGVYNQLASPVFSNCEFYNNTSDSGGGGMYNYDASPALTDCSFTNNSSNNGAGIYNYSLTTSNPVLINCSFVGNTGSGICNVQSSPFLTNCIIYANNGIGLQNYNSAPILINCTFSANSGLTVGGYLTRTHPLN